MSEQPSTSTASTATPALASVREEELSLMKCLNWKEMVEYELKWRPW